MITKRNKFVFIKKKIEIKKERFDSKSILGIIVAGKTIKLDNIYMNLLYFSQENIS